MSSTKETLSIVNMSWLPFVALVPPPTITCVTLLPLTLPFATLVGADVVEIKMKVQRRSLGQTCFQCESLACCFVSGQSFTLKVVTRKIAGCQIKKLLLQPGHCPVANLGNKRIQSSRARTAHGRPCWRMS